jgi:C4-dicarboxylate transporter, DctM subunit
MSLLEIGYLAIVVMLFLIAIGIPIAWAMGIVGIVGELYVTGFTRTAAQISLITWENGTLFVFIALPLFLLMGQLAFRTGITNDLYDCVHKWFGWMPGGLAVAAVISNAAYGAVTGNSVASVATMGPMVMPEFRKYKYDLSLATGTLASAGTLAILVPPSTGMVIYGVWTETSIGALFLAGIVPCIILTIAYCIVLIVWCRLRPELGPKGPTYPLNVRIASLARLLPAIAVVTIVMGGIYGGIMTPSESAAVGVVGVLAIAAVMRRLTLAAIVDSLHSTILTSGMVFAIMITGVLFSRFMVHTSVSADIVQFIGGLDLHRVALLMSMLLFYFILGTALDTFGMLILSLPFVMPIVVAAQIDKVWFGVFVAVMVELAAVSPPVGITVAVMRAVAPDVPTTAIFRGCYPFLVLTILLTMLLIAVPDLALWLPRVGAP